MHVTGRHQSAQMFTAVTRMRDVTTVAELRQLVLLFEVTEVDLFLHVSVRTSWPLIMNASS